MAITLDAFTLLLIVLGAADLAAAPILFTFWWEDRISR